MSIDFEDKHWIDDTTYRTRLGEDMSKTTNEKNYDFGVIPSGYVADDHNGHKGYGWSPEAAQKALEQAQDHGVEYSEHKAITGIIIDSKK